MILFHAAARIEYWKTHALDYVKERQNGNDPMNNPEQLEGTMYSLWALI
jgi:hypothetical protein